MTTYLTVGDTSVNGPTSYVEDKNYWCYIWLNKLFDSNIIWAFLLVREKETSGIILEQSHFKLLIKTIDEKSLFQAEVSFNQLIMIIC